MHFILKIIIASYFQEFRESKILPLNKQIAEVNKLGQGLVQSATAGVNTSDVELQLEKLNSLWNNLQESVSFLSF